MVDAILDSWQCSDDALIVGDFVWSSLLLGDLSKSIECSDEKHEGMAIH